VENSGEDAGRTTFGAGLLTLGLSSLKYRSRTKSETVKLRIYHICINSREKRPFRRREGDGRNLADLEVVRV